MKIHTGNKKICLLDLNKDKTHIFNHTIFPWNPWCVDNIEGLKKEKEFIKTEDVIKGEELKNNTIYDVDPRQAAVGHGTDQIDLSKVKFQTF